MRSILLVLAIAGGVAEAAPPATVRTVVQKRAVFDLVSGKTDLRALCDGQTPVSVELRRTAGDVAAAVFTGLWYTPAHLRVTCGG